MYKSHLDPQITFSLNELENISSLKAFHRRIYQHHLFCETLHAKSLKSLCVTPAIFSHKLNLGMSTIHFSNIMEAPQQEREKKIYHLAAQREHSQMFIQMLLSSNVKFLQKS